MCYTYSQRRIRASVLFHGILGIKSMLTTDHLNKSMALFLVNNASLYITILIEESLQFMLGTTVESQYGQQR